MAATPDEMFERVLGYCGFSSVLGPGILQRALADEGVTREAATAADYKRALPRLEGRMKAYMPAEDTGPRIRRIVGYLAFVEGDLDFDDDHAFSKIGHTYQQLKARELATRSVSGVVERAETVTPEKPESRDASEKK